MKPYKGMQNSKGGVIGMLEVILSDFVRVDSETTADEKTSQMEYDKFMTDAKADKKAKHKSEVQLKLDKDQAEFEKSELAEDKADKKAKHKSEVQLKLDKDQAEFEKS